MTKATLAGGDLQTLSDKCYVIVPGFGKIQLKILPEITDSQNASYSEEKIPGRSSPITIFSSTEARTISMAASFQVISDGDINQNVNYLWAFRSCLYPRPGEENPLKPPVICKLKCGWLIGDDEICVVLTSFSVNPSKEYVWDPALLVPYFFTVNLGWRVVYPSSNLPNQDRILQHGY